MLPNFFYITYIFGVKWGLADSCRWLGDRSKPPSFQVDDVGWGGWVQYFCAAFMWYVDETLAGKIGNLGFRITCRLTVSVGDFGIGIQQLEWHGNTMGPLLAPFGSQLWWDVGPTMLMRLACWFDWAAWPGGWLQSVRNLLMSPCYFRVGHVSGGSYWWMHFVVFRLSPLSSRSFLYKVCFLYCG